MSMPQKVFHRESTARLVVYLDSVYECGAQAATGQNDIHTLLGQARHFAVIHRHSSHDQPLDLPLHHRPDDVPLIGRLLDRASQKQGVVRAFDGLLYAGYEFGVERVRDAGHDDADRVALPDRQPPRHGVGAELEPTDRRSDALSCLARDVVVLVRRQVLGNRRLGHASSVGHISDGRSHRLRWKPVSHSGECHRPHVTCQGLSTTRLLAIEGVAVGRRDGGRVGVKVSRRWGFSRCPSGRLPPHLCVPDRAGRSAPVCMGLACEAPVRRLRRRELGSGGSAVRSGPGTP